MHTRNTRSTKGYLLFYPFNQIIFKNKLADIIMQMIPIGCPILSLGPLLKLFFIMVISLFIIFIRYSNLCNLVFL